MDVIVTVSTPTAQAAKAVTSTVPIVMATSADPVGDGMVQSLARPGGNIAGFSLAVGPEIEAKRLLGQRPAAFQQRKIPVRENVRTGAVRALARATPMYIILR